MSKASKRRTCPALGHEIAPADCGEQRLSRLVCPGSCAFNPFASANYDDLLAMEDQLDMLSVKRLLVEEPAAGEAINQTVRGNQGHGLHAGTVWQLFFRLDAAGRTFAERWEAAGFAGLKNDQRTFLRGKMGMRVALLEVQQVCDGQSIRVVDLLEPEAAPRVIVDRASAARLVRFSTVLTWIYPLPHFWRMSGTGIILPDAGPWSPSDALGEIIGHLKGPRKAGTERARWLAENFCLIDRAVTAVARARRQMMFEGLDAQWGIAHYELADNLAKCRKALAGHPDVVEESLGQDELDEGWKHGWAWLDEAPAAVTPARSVKGRILLRRKAARIEAMGAARLADLRARFEGRMGALAKFVSERRNDLGRRQAAAEPSVKMDLVPPALLEAPVKMELQSSRVPPPPPGMSLEAYSAQLHGEQLLTLPDDPLPALGGRTLREAATRPALRPALLRLMKDRVRTLDENNLKSGRSDDINPLLRELGLHELDFPPPPPRAILQEPENDDTFDDEGDAEEGGFPADPTRPAAPVLTEPPLTLDQALARLDQVLAGLATAADGFDELDLSGSTLFDDIEQLADGRLDDAGFDYLVPFALQAWFSLVPKGVRAPALRRHAMQAAISSAEAELRLVDQGGPRAFERFGLACRQPALFEALVAGIMQSVGKVPKAMRPAPQGIVGMLLILRVLLDELDQARRAG